MSGATCDGCGRSIWSCNLEGGAECLAYVDEHSAASHERMKSARPSVLRYHSLQLGDDGTTELVYLQCICGTTLAVSPEQWVRSAVYPPSLEHS